MIFSKLESLSSTSHPWYGVLVSRVKNFGTEGFLVGDLLGERAGVLITASGLSLGICEGVVDFNKGKLASGSLGSSDILPIAVAMDVSRFRATIGVAPRLDSLNERPSIAVDKETFLWDFTGEPELAQSEMAWVS